MAGRPNKQGIDYFPLDVGFFSDLKIRKIAKGCGPNSTSVLICLLCNIYRNDGYYILWDEDLPFFIADEVGVSEGCVKEVLLKSLQVGFFDVEKHSAYGILTSCGIQKRFFEITKRRGAIEVIEEYLINDGDKSIFACKNSINASNNEQSKVKEKKFNPPSIPPGGEDFERKLKELEEKEARLLAKEQELLKKETALKSVPKPPDISFVADEFKEVFLWWLEYKRQRRESYKSEKSLKTCYGKLLQLSGNSPGKAKLVIEQSMANNWAGLFELKQNGNDRSSNTSKQEANAYALGLLQQHKRDLEAGLADEMERPF